MKEMVYSSDPNADREILDEGYAHGYHYCIVSLGSHPCAYVEIPKGHPYYGLDYEKIKVSCHGGLTYSDLCFRMRSGLAGTMRTSVTVSSCRATEPRARHGQRAKYWPMLSAWCISFPGLEGNDEWND